MIYRARSARQPDGKTAVAGELPRRSRRVWVLAQLLGAFVTLVLVSSASPVAALAGGGGGGGCGYGWYGSQCEHCGYGDGNCECDYFNGFDCESVNFSIVKEQRIRGESSYTASKLTGAVGQTVEYKITVTNTGNS